MNYLLKNKSRNPFRKKIISIVILFLLLSLSIFLFPNAVRTLSYTISKPLWSLGDVVTRPLTGIKDFFVFRNTLIAENISLKEELSSLKLKEIDYDVLSKENQDLKNQLGRKDNDRVVSRVLSRPPVSPYDTFVIDVGSREGIIPGSKVYYSNNVIIGEVSSVTSNTSLVRLFSTGNQKQEAILQRTGTSFVLVGHGGTNFDLEVPKDTDVLWGDVFLYPGIASSVLGSVYYIDTNSQSAFKTVYLRVPGNMFSADYLFVEKSII